jgi:pilus assembly protein CpaB
MNLRNVLLAGGAASVLAGVVLLFILVGKMGGPPAPPPPVESRQTILVAAQAIQTGKTLQEKDIAFKEVGQSEAQGKLLRDQKDEILNKTSQRDFAPGDPLIKNDFAIPNRLASELKPGYRGVSIPVEPPQSVAGLALPGDHVDVLLTQTFDDKVVTNPGLKAVGETVLRDVRVMAIDQSLNPPSSVVSTLSTVSTEARTPKTVTLEVTERQAEVLLVAAQLGKIQLAVRPLETASAARAEEEREGHQASASKVSPGPDEIAWASMVSPGLAKLTSLQPMTVRIYSGMPKSDGYVCSDSACAPTDVTTITTYQGTPK